jgi:hypothetical protein
MASVGPAVSLEPATKTLASADVLVLERQALSGLDGISARQVREARSVLVG